MTSPIVIVEDDNDDREVLIYVFREIGIVNEFRCFGNGESALTYLRETIERPFIIISDINMPKMDGLLLKKVINEDKTLRTKQIPFIYLSTSKNVKLLETAFNLSIQGYFQKPNDIKSLKEIAKTIITYWNKSCFV